MGDNPGHESGYGEGPRWRDGESDRDRERVASLEVRMQNLERQAQNWVTKWEFYPIRAIGYGLAVLCMTAVIMGMLALVLKGPLHP